MLDDLGQRNYGSDMTTNNLNNEKPFVITILPEPTTMALFGLGGLALLRRRRSA